MNDWYLSPKERVLARLHTSERGLTTHEAKIIQMRQERTP